MSMQMPSLSTIQASILVCPVLVCSRDETACKFIGVHFARNISVRLCPILPSTGTHSNQMAKRAGLFEPTRFADYKTLTEDTFDWHAWIEHELRNRMACAIFTYDIAGCIFESKNPTLSPLDQNVDLPCYESCWEAKTASECLAQLKSTPEGVA